jgi:predicted DNA-binding transcriptional regulator AlpA
MTKDEALELIDEATACQMIGGQNSPISRSTLWRGVRTGRYPSPIKVGVCANRWRASEVIAVIEKAAAARSVVEAA